MSDDPNMTDNTTPQTATATAITVINTDNGYVEFSDGTRVGMSINRNYGSGPKDRYACDFSISFNYYYCAAITQAQREAIAEYGARWYARQCVEEDRIHAAETAEIEKVIAKFRDDIMIPRVRAREMATIAIVETGIRRASSAREFTAAHI